MTNHLSSGDVIRAAIDIYARTPDGFTIQLVTINQRSYASKIVKTMSDAGVLFKTELQGRINHYFFTRQGAANYKARVGAELSFKKSRFNGCSTQTPINNKSVKPTISTELTT